MYNLSKSEIIPIRRILETEILDDFWSWAEKMFREVAPNSKLEAAFTYAFNQKEGLMNYLSDGNCSISNNLAKNSQSQRCQSKCRDYTLVETANANGLRPMKYIHYILKDLPAFNFPEFTEDLDEFLPWNPISKKYADKKVVLLDYKTEVQPFSIHYVI